MKKTVNLDAMISREDFKVEKGFSGANRFKQLKANDLKSEAPMRYMIKKPDFQRGNTRLECFTNYKFYF